MMARSGRGYRLGATTRFLAATARSSASPSMNSQSGAWSTESTRPLNEREGRHRSHCLICNRRQPFVHRHRADALPLHLRARERGDVGHHALHAARFIRHSFHRLNSLGLRLVTAWDSPPCEDGAWKVSEREGQLIRCDRPPWHCTALTL